MPTKTTKFTIRLPRQDVEFAKAHDLTVTEVIGRYLRRLRSSEKAALSPELETITGLIPADIDTRTAYQQHLGEKHR